MVSVHRQDEKVTSPLVADRETTETKQKLPRMLQNCPQREPLFLSNNPLSYWTEKVDPKEAEKGAFEGAEALGWAPKPGTLLAECSKRDCVLMWP